MAPNRRYGSGLFPGVVLIAVGTIFLLERFDWISMRQVWRLWPMFVIWMGLANLLSPGKGRRSIFLLLIGLWLQISTLELFGLDFGESWPLAIIAVGASFVFDAMLYGGSRESRHNVIVEVEAGADPDAAEAGYESRGEDSHEE